MSRSELKSLAKEQIKGNILTYFIITIIMFVPIYALNMVPYVGWILSLIVSAVFSIGLVRTCFKMTEGEKIKVGDLFDVKDVAGKAILLTILTSIYTVLWSLLLIIPGIIKSYSYSAAPYILVKNPGMSAEEALKKSIAIMDGHKWELFKLEFSFILWGFLTLITLGIASIYVTPYMSVTFTNFYKNLGLEE